MLHSALCLLQIFNVFYSPRLLLRERVPVVGDVTRRQSRHLSVFLKPAEIVFLASISTRSLEFSHQRDHTNSLINRISRLTCPHFSYWRKTSSQATHYAMTLRHYSCWEIFLTRVYNMITGQHSHGNRERTSFQQSDSNNMILLLKLSIVYSGWLLFFAVSSVWDPT